MSVSLLLSAPNTFENPIIRIGEDFEEQGLFLENPAAAIVFRGKLYIADYSHQVFIFSDGKFEKMVGGKGAGPKEIRLWDGFWAN